MLGFTPPQWALSLWFTCKGATAACAGGTGAPKRPELPTGAWTQGGLVAAWKGTKIWKGPKGPKGPKRTRTSFDPSFFCFLVVGFGVDELEIVGTCFNHFHVWESALKPWTCGVIQSLTHRHQNVDAQSETNLPYKKRRALKNCCAALPKVWNYSTATPHTVDLQGRTHQNKKT